MSDSLAKRIGSWIGVGDSFARQVYGLAPTQKRVSAAEYNSSTVYAVEILNIGTGDLTLSPSSGDADIVITAAELILMGVNAYSKTFYGEYNSVTAGAGMELLAYTA